MLSAKSVSQLKRLIKAAKDAYYNSGKTLKVNTEQLTSDLAALLLHGSVSRGKVVYPDVEEIQDKSVRITDPVYDMLELALKEIDPNSPLLKQVRAEAPSGRQVEVTLPFLMPSLDKKLSGEGTLQKWLAKYPGPYIIMDKLDGVSMELLWDNGQFDKLYKGGSATKGMDWSHAIEHLRLPKKVPAGHGGVRAELIMSKAEFLKKWAEKYKNARNLTSGIVNKTRGIHEAIGSITPIVFDVLHKRMAPSAALKWAEQQGFTVVHHIKATSITEEKLLKYLRTREKADHMIDGLVIAVDKPTPLTEDNPKTIIAYKAPSEGNYAETKVTEVEWRVTRHGRLVPRLSIEPVKLAGVTVTHATFHNARQAVDNKINVGSVVGVIRSGEVIPYVEKVIRPSKTPSMPDKSVVGNYKWDANKTHLILTDAKSNDRGRIRAIAHFFAEGLGVEDMGEGVVGQLYSAGYDTIGKIIRLRVKDYMDLEGWQQRKAEKIYNNIQKACQGADIVKVMAGSGVFGALIGERKLNALRKARPELFDPNKAFTDSQVAKLVEGVPGFKDKSTRPIIDNYNRCMVWLRKLPITFKKPAIIKATGDRMAGEIVVFTGFRPKSNLPIEEQGGVVGTSVNNKTTILVAKDLGALRGKGDKAKSLGITILSIPQFEKKYGIALQ